MRVGMWVFGGGGGVLQGRKVPACCETLKGERVLMAVDAFSVRGISPDRICLLCELSLQKR